MGNKWHRKESKMEELSIKLTLDEWIEISILAGNALNYDCEESEAVEKLDSILKKEEK